MELQYIVMTIIKILISVPCILMVHYANVEAASLMGGHFNNNGNSSLPSSDENSNATSSVLYADYEEEIPDPSALILPGYNLPDNIFNKGKPFYLEKDPVTGQVDFESKTAMSNMDEYDYVDEEPSPDLFDKANIDRKDGSLSSHKPSDVNQLTPNFHDFLNLPVKYNPEKYVYPLISSSYANTKVQGNINKYHNHKNYIVTTYKPTYFTVKTPYFNPNNAVSTGVPTTTTTSTTTTSTTPKPITYRNNIAERTTEEVYFTTKNINNIYFTTPTTTKRTLSLFEQLFGEYDEITTQKPPTEKTTKRPMDFDNVLTGTEMGHESAYEYEDDYGGDFQNNTVAYQTKPVKFDMKTTTHRPAPTTTTTPITTTTIVTSTTTTTTEATSRPVQNSENLPEIAITNTTPKVVHVTSMQLGEKHYSTADTRSPIIAVTQHNIKDQLNNERVPKPFSYQPISNTNSIRILPNQDTVSFVVGNHQHVGGDYETQFPDSPYESNPFRPLIIQPDSNIDTVSYVVQAKPILTELAKPQPEIGGSSISIQPIKTSEASLSIGVPVNSIKKIPGQVVDDNLSSEKIEFPKIGTGAKIVFPDDAPDTISTIIPNLQPPPPHPSPPTQPFNKDILHLNSKPMYHQLPSDLTPPSEQDLTVSHKDRPRPPWDPRPGHFHNGKPEYLRPPRPQLKPQNDIYKRIDKLPNILPQFRPNTKLPTPHYFDKNGYLRQPLLERPSNRPVSFFEKLLPPAPPKNLHNIRKVPVLEDRNLEKRHEHFEFYQHQTPPSILLNNRRTGSEPAVETLQMLQAKQHDKKELPKTTTTTTFKSAKVKEGTDKPLYVVYPVNSAPIKLDALDTNKKETVVIGTRAELPLPPSKINQEFTYESPQDRNDSPILKPHSKVNFPLKSSFPYPMERPELSSTTVVGNNLEMKDETGWGRITSSKINYKSPNQISVTLKTYTEKPIAIAYTPTEPYGHDKYSMPNYASPVISEIRPGFSDIRDSEITLSAVMHTAHQPNLNSNYQIAPFASAIVNHKSEIEETPLKLDFQAPFQASVNVDGMTPGWTVIRKTDKNKIDRSDDDVEATTMALATTREFDIENFKPELFGGFKPIYNYSDMVQTNDTAPSGDHQERDRKL